MASSFAYVQNLPDAMGAMISLAVQEYASRNKLQSEVWYQGLPIWIIREANSRVNKVQVEAVQHDGRSIVSFTPDAYEDKDESREGLRRLRRRSAVDAAIIKARASMDFGELIERVSGGPTAARKDALDSVLKAIDDTLAHARALPLVEEDIVVAYRTPFAP